MLIGIEPRVGPPRMPNATTRSDLSPTSRWQRSSSWCRSDAFSRCTSASSACSVAITACAISSRPAAGPPPSGRTPPPDSSHPSPVPSDPRHDGVETLTRQRWRAGRRLALGHGGHERPAVGLHAAVPRSAHGVKANNVGYSRPRDSAKMARPPRFASARGSPDPGSVGAHEAGNHDHRADPTRATRAALPTGPAFGLSRSQST